ncbi:MAG: type III-B CRISPR module-associated protein Cmr5, partial [Burkholderiales bacterium]
AIEPTARDDYTNLAKAMPMMVMNSGLMQTLAFLKEKDKRHHKALLNDVIHWITKQGEGESITPFAQLMGDLFEKTPVQFRHCTAETHAILRWIRQLAPTL